MADIDRRLRHLLRERAALADGPSLKPVLRHVVTVARELVGVPYAAAGILDEDGQLDDFVYEGIDEPTAELIGAPPEGHGLLGNLLDRATPIRVDDLAEQPGTAGFPPRHPVMKSFLGVPIRIQGRTRGQLYLADPARGRFDSDDEDLVVALVTSTAVAIENVELRRHSRQRERWLAAAAAAAGQVLGGGGARPFDPVPRFAQQTAEADFATLVLVTDQDRLQLQAATGIFADEAPGRLLDMDTSLAGQVVRSARPVRTQGYPDTGDTHVAARIGSVVVVPIASGGVVIGALGVGRLAPRRSYTDADIGHLVEFAEHVGLAMELSRARTRTRDRGAAEVDRISVELDKQVVQRLFAVSLGLEGLMTIGMSPVVRDRLTRSVSALDDSIDRIRSMVYGIDSTIGRDRPRSLQHQVLAAVEDCTPALGLSVTTTFSGELDSTVPDAVADTVIEIVHLVLQSIAEHAGASRVELGMTVSADLLTIDVVDNGSETHAPGPSLREQAEAHAGRLDTHSTPTGGTRMTWTAKMA
ncbi:GAF domain-containing sensor histidine kinase [Labedaea rhizosphaerae]|uniref:GAF domain-containing protein n=1 Tax=Labedaea rhizosphaerae TaxID=598644 RepID=A0A4R6S9R0_LABRH|nr:GAF domain-containing protein [Labedaea rhizosphaerae]TDP96204.1 GAF domain-containing protein [Labedaea rhizosphaerae]